MAAIRALPALALRAMAREILRSPGGPGPRPFPLGDPRTHLVYLGRNAVWRAMAGLGLAQGDEVLMPAYHHGVEVEAICAAGMKAAFYRIGADLQPDLEHVRVLLRRPRARVLYVIHFLGYPQPLSPLRDLAREAGAWLVEDCALALFSADADGTPLGSRGDAAIFSFYKTLPVPDGGALWLRRGRPGSPPLRAPPWGSMLGEAAAIALAGAAQEGRTGLVRAGRAGIRLVKRVVDVRARLGDAPVGTSHLDPGHLDLGISPLARRLALSLGADDASRIAGARRRNFERLARALGDPSAWALPLPAPGTTPLFFPLLARDGSEKTALLAALASQGVEAVDFWRVAHASLPRGTFPEVDRLRERVVELPIHQGLHEADVDRLARAVAESLARIRGAGRRPPA